MVGSALIADDGAYTMMNSCCCSTVSVSDTTTLQTKTRTGALRLSVLIPVYNWDLSSLLKSLLAEIDAFDLSAEVEVIVIDDSSSDAELLAGNAAFLAAHARPFLKYRALESNVGRSAIRNMLAEEAHGEFLLFLDCDVLPDAPEFIRNYLSHAKGNGFDVVCGGISYRTRVLKGAEYDYHAYLGNKKEVKAAAQRNLAPWRHILTSNIMVRKSVFQTTHFDERFTGYGYEDIEWGVRLAEKFRVLHTDNTASHLGLVTRERAYEKMRNSVPNYLLLKEICPEAFAASGISKVAGLLTSCSGALLNLLDPALKGLFLKSASDRLAFIFFQLDFAVLLAGSLKGSSRACKAR